MRRQDVEPRHVGVAAAAARIFYIFTVITNGANQITTLIIPLTTLAS